MKAELQKFLKLFEELEEAGETASLTLVTKGGKTTIKLQLESSPSLPSTTTSTTTQPLPPAPGKRRRHRGARARSRRNQRAAAHQAFLAEAATSTRPPPRLHPSPPSESGRRHVMTVARPDVPTFSTLNVDGPSSPPPAPPPPLPSSMRPPFCYFNCEKKLWDHCPNCGRCAFLCIEHNGCHCDPEQKEDDCKDICAVCECQEGVRYQYPRKPT